MVERTSNSHCKHCRVNCAGSSEPIAFPHVGFGQRWGNNRLAGGWQSPGKMLCALAYFLPIVSHCKFDLVELGQDLSVSLQLLLQGHPNAIWNETVIDSRPNAAGGCSTYRTTEMWNAAARKLAALFPNHVAIVERNYKTSMPRLERLEVMVRWQQALADGRKKGGDATK